MKKIGSVFAFSVLLCSGLVGSAPASAEPRDCTTYILNPPGTWGDGGAYCRSGRGGFRVRVNCDGPLWFNYDRFGNWMNPGSDFSRARCDWGDDALSAAWELRN
ncbi:hypothetical protein GCM10022247_73900 [Allokutzneria multivorans]|uniref:Uncharacterized protein n=1 Tax=Allokutzneria multivorans TaxID=1142134 RepID=A0ABP7U7H6_9PSEU